MIINVCQACDTGEGKAVYGFAVSRKGIAYTLLKRGEKQPMT